MQTTKLKSRNRYETESTSEGYDMAVELMRACSTPHGFLAAPTEKANYHRIWGRDGSIISLAALLTPEIELKETARRTFETLAQYQGPHGEIPSNVDPESGRVSFGGAAGRVDADLWFVIGCGEYWLATGDDAFLERVLPVLQRVRFLLGAWEYNARGLLYVPPTGDWADEYLHQGYVLYDQVLYLQAQRTLGEIHRTYHGSTDHALEEKISQLEHLIQTNYWFDDCDEIPQDAYHDVLYQKGCNSAKCRCAYWVSFFSPQGYGYRFDALANVLVSLLGAASQERTQKVDDFIGQIVTNDLPLLPAFHPVIRPVDEDWEELQMSFSYSFKNQPYEYQNGGLWPMITGFYVADLARRGRRDLAQRFLDAIHRANALEMEGESWGFPEYVNGAKLTPGGTRHQGWSAAAAVTGQAALDGQSLFRF